jgi:hypothetical protein
MAKALPIVGIVLAVLAAAFASIVSGAFVPLVVLAGMAATGVLLFFERNGPARILGIAVIVLGLLAILSYPISGNQKTFIPSLPDYFTDAWQSTLLLAGCVAVLAARRASLQPAWLLWLGLGCAVLAAALAATVPHGQYASATPLALLAGLLALAVAWPMVALVRAEPAASGSSIAPPARAAAEAPPKAASAKGKGK